MKELNFKNIFASQYRKKIPYRIICHAKIPLGIRMFRTLLQANSKSFSCRLVSCEEEVPEVHRQDSKSGEDDDMEDEEDPYKNLTPEELSK